MSNFLCFDLDKDPFAPLEPKPDLSGNKHDNFFLQLLHFVRIVAWVDECHYTFVKENIEPRFISNFKYILRNIKKHPDKRVRMMEWFKSFEKFRGIQNQTSDPYFFMLTDIYNLDMIFDHKEDSDTIFFYIKPMRNIKYYRLDVIIPL